MGQRRDQLGELPDPRAFAECSSWVKDLAAVDSELRRVFEKWGEQTLTLLDWTSVLGEEFGEVCRAVNVFEFGTHGEDDLDHVYGEAIQTAAVAIHMAAIIREARSHTA